MGITIDMVPIQGTSSDAIDGDEKFLAVDGNGRPVTVGVNQILNKVDDRIDDVIDELFDQLFSEIIDEKVDAAVDDRLDEVLDNVGNLNWNDVS